MKNLLKSVVGLSSFLLIGQTAHAGHLPDIEVPDLLINISPTVVSVQDASPGSDMDNIALAGNPNQIIAYDTTYNMIANFGAGGAFTGGTIEIDSDEITEYSLTDGSFIQDDFNNYIVGQPAVPILTGNLTSYESAGGKMQLSFDVTGGLVSSGLGDFGWFGKYGAITVSSDINAADVYGVPTPQAGIAGSALLGGLALLPGDAMASPD